MRWDVERDGAQVHLTICVYARKNKEKTGTTRATFDQTTQAEDNGPFVFLDDLRLISSSKYISVFHREINFISNDEKQCKGTETRMIAIVMEVR